MVVEGLHSISTFESLHKRHLRVSRLLKTCLIQCSSLDENQSHPRGPPGSRKRLTSVRLLLLKACSSILAVIEEKYPVLGLYDGFAKKKWTSKLNSLFTKERIRGMMESRSHVAVDSVIPFVPVFTDKSYDFLERCDATGMSLGYTERLEKVLVSHKGGA